MYKVTATSETLDIRTAVGVSFAELEKVERKANTAQYSKTVFESAAFKRHILNESNRFGKSIVTIDDDGNATKTTYFSINNDVEKVTYKFIKQ